ncbi:MAG: cellulase family glycosylhydrolase [Ignavibacteriales bacterium]|nr:cellulase family glycosylhydrolase [Ignavibacteriales bacterium]
MVRNLILIFLLMASFVYPQKDSDKNKDVFVDESGVMRWKDSNEEVSLFGVNYTTPFAYSYRAHKRLGLSIKKAIDMDVAQMVRLSFDAFRVHVWDREISDEYGNLKQNEHLDLLDYLLEKLASNGIKTIITPIAWWGTGWPEPDEKTEGFSQNYSKQELITNQNARAAERNYLKQFIEHVNPYRKINYKNDSSIIALEIINEPFHPQDGIETTNYINEMVKVIRDAGYSKPIFYNISQNWSAIQAQAVSNANVDGFSFQWYPTDLVHNKMLQGNYLMNVNKYSIPSESVIGYNKRAKMVYESDAADVGGSYMYPAMARSFREAGMQFATMFSYDPVQIAWSNTEYPTHYMNLLYTPSKAISLMIAARAFKLLPRQKKYDDYPNNNVFSPFRVSYEEDLSEMNTETEFYYSNNTQSIPLNKNLLEHIAGCGSSALIKYDGTGTYFIDKLDDGIWKLDLYPDVVWITDPFGANSLSRSVARLFWNERKINVDLPDLGKAFKISSFNRKEKLNIEINENSFNVKPGMYLLSREGISFGKILKHLTKENNFFTDFYQLPEKEPKIYVINNSKNEVTENKSFEANLKICSSKKICSVNLFIKRLGWKGFEKHEVKFIKGFDYKVNINSNIIKPGLLQYCIAVNDGQKTYTFPDGIEGSPDSWDFKSDKFWNIKCVRKDDAIFLFDALRDQRDLIFPHYNPSMKYNSDYTLGSSPDKIALSVQINFKGLVEKPFGLQLNVEDFLKPRMEELNKFNFITIKGKALQDSVCNLTILLRMKDGNSFASSIQLMNNWQELVLPLKSFIEKESLVLPESYPLFLPKMWKNSMNENQKFNLNDLLTLQIIYQDSENRIVGSEYKAGFELEEITLNK